MKVVELFPDDIFGQSVLNLDGLMFLMRIANSKEAIYPMIIGQKPPKVYGHRNHTPSETKWANIVIIDDTPDNNGGYPTFKQTFTSSGELADLEPYGYLQEAPNSGFAYRHWITETQDYKQARICDFFAYGSDELDLYSAKPKVEIEKYLDFDDIIVIRNTTLYNGQPFEEVRNHEVRLHGANWKVEGYKEGAGIDNYKHWSWAHPNQVDNTNTGGGRADYLLVTTNPNYELTSDIKGDSEWGQPKVDLILPNYLQNHSRNIILKQYHWVKNTIKPDLEINIGRDILPVLNA